MARQHAQVVPGAYTCNGVGSGNNYANSHKRRKYTDSGSYSKTVLSPIAESLTEQATGQD
jgi:hypothetical protein